MSNDLQDKLVEVIGALQSAVAQTADFAMSQLPDIATTYVLYGRVSTLLFFLCALSVVCGSVYIACRYGFAKSAKDDMRFPALLVPALLLIFLAPVLVISADNMMLAWLAPKVWLIKELASLVK